MTQKNPTITPEQIQSAAASLHKRWPSYKPLLDFYANIFGTQEDSKRTIDLTPLQLSDEIIKIKAQEKFPLIDITDFVIDLPAATTLLEEICKIAVNANEEMSASSQALAESLKADKINPEDLFSALLKGDDIYFQQVIKNTPGLELKVLLFITYSAIAPCLALFAEQLASYRPENDDDVWDKGYCPICGSAPGLAMLQNEGERVLVCSFCRHEWSARRIFCPFCENTDSDTLQYFVVQDDDEYRVDVCENCKRFIKTVDLRKINRIIYSPLEQIATLHLDMKATEAGYISGLGIPV